MNDSPPEAAAAPPTNAENYLMLEEIGADFEAEWTRATRNGTRPPQAASFLPRVSDVLREQLADLLDRIDRKHQAAAAIPGLPGYELMAVIARSYMGVVYQARELATNRVVVVKVLLEAEKTRGRRQAEIWRDESELVAGLDHPHIVPVREVGSHDSCMFLVMPYVDGGDLHRRIDEFSLAGVTNHEVVIARTATIARIITQVAKAVDYVHRRGVIHRDLKPSNILIDSTGKALVCDFGLARRLQDPSGLTASGQLIGTPMYMAPEQARGERVPTVAVDIWSIGAVLYELLSGHAPFCDDAPPVHVLLARKHEDGAAPAAPSEVNNTVPIDPDLEWICLRCLAHDPNKRFTSAAELVVELEKFQKGDRVRPPDSIGRWVRDTIAAVARQVNRPPAQADYIRRWRWALRTEACTSLIAHGTLCYLVQSGAAAPWVWAVFLLGDTITGWIIWHLIMRRSRLTGMERNLLQVWIGTDLTAVLLFALTVPLARPPSVTEIAAFYSPYLMLRGLVFFIEGRMCWGRLYVTSLGFYAAAVAVQFAQPWAPLLYAGVYAVWFVWLSFCRWDAVPSPTVRVHPS